MARARLLQLHRWIGLTAGLYVVFIGVTGAALVFRQELQAARYPDYFRAQTSAPAPPVDTILRELESAYPGYRISGIDWPTYRRATFLAYVSRGTDFKTVFSDPATGRVSGELPFDWIRRLQELHFNLLSGRTGLIVNGIGAAALLFLAISGLVVRWRGARRRLLHVRVGVWVSPVILMWALTGLYFAFPQPFRNTINAASTLTIVRAPESKPQAARTPADPEQLIARALSAWPDARIARFVFPFGDRGTFLVVLARAVHGDVDTTDEVSLYFDQYTGDLLLTRDHGRRTAGDTLTAWIGPLHMGTFGGAASKAVWFALALALPILAVTGAFVWWKR